MTLLHLDSRETFMPLDGIVPIVPIDSYTPIIVDPFEGQAITPPAVAYTVASRVGLRNCGAPYFALTHEPISAPGFVYSVGRFQAYQNVEVRFHSMPEQLADPNERHIVSSYHEIGGTGRELVNIAVSPSGAVTAHVQGFGVITTQQGLIQPTQQYLIEVVADWPFLFFPQRPGTVSLFLNGQPVSTFTTTAWTLFPAESLPRRFMLFNGRDGRSRYQATISHAQYAQADEFVNISQIAWDFTSGSAALVPATVFSGDFVPEGFSGWGGFLYIAPHGVWDLQPIWFDPDTYGMPRLYGPPPGGSALSCSARGDQAFFTNRPASSPSYAAGATPGGAYTPQPTPGVGYSPASPPPTTFTPEP